MNTIYFMNNGELDIEALTTFGVSAKDGSNPIGKFGTGFKYAVAIILRLGGSVSINNNGNNYVFSAEKRTVRNKEFSFVKMNGENVGFTTHLGSHWEPWQAYREIYCNCIDEQGTVSYENSTSHDISIKVDCSEIYHAHKNRSRYFLQSKPVYILDDVDFHEEAGLFYYFKGVAVHDAGDHLFSFNITRDVDLTEDRTAKYPDYDIKMKIAQAIQKCQDSDLIRKMITSKLDGDKKIPYSKEYETSVEFIDVCRTLLAQDIGIPETVQRVFFNKNKNKGDWPEKSITRVQQSMIKKAISLLESIGISDQYPIKIASGLGDNVMGLAHNDTIYLSIIPFEQGSKQVASTILEEYVHLKYGCEDFDRQMQNWLFDKIISLGEELIGEPV